MPLEHKWDETDDEFIARVIGELGLPDLPEPDEDDPEGRELVVFQFKGETIMLAEGIPLADAMEYCDREDTHGDGWFAGFRR
jgi:hypothetical protein